MYFNMERHGHILTMSFIFCMLMIELWGLANPGGTAPPQASQLLETGSNLPKSGLFRFKPTSPKPTIQPPRLSPLIIWATVSCLNHPRARYQTPRNNPMSQSLLTLFGLANPKPASTASPIPSSGNYNQGSCPHFPSLPLPPD